MDSPCSADSMPLEPLPNTPPPCRCNVLDSSIAQITRPPAIIVMAIAELNCSSVGAGGLEGEDGLTYARGRGEVNEPSCDGEMIRLLAARVL